MHLNDWLNKKQIKTASTVLIRRICCMNRVFLLLLTQFSDVIFKAKFCYDNALYIFAIISSWNFKNIFLSYFMVKATTTQIDSFALIFHFSKF